MTSLSTLLDTYLAADDALLAALRADDVRDEYDPRALARVRALDALREALAAVDAAQKDDR